MTKPHCICPNGEHLLSCPVPTVDGWEADFNEWWFKGKGPIQERGMRAFIRETRAQAYYQGQKDEFHSNAGSIAQAKAEAIAEVVKIIKEMEMKTGWIPLGSSKDPYNRALTDLLSRISNK